MQLVNSKKRVSFSVRSTSPLGENLGENLGEKESVSLSEKLQNIGVKSKLELLREKDAAREATQFGTIPSGPMRRRAESKLAEVRSDPIPSDLVDAFKWADTKNVSHGYVRSLIKQKEGSLPLVGGTLPYGLEALEALWRNDYQNRREKGIKKSAAARFKAEKMKLGLELLEGPTSPSLNKTVSDKIKELDLLKKNFELNEKLLSFEFQVQEQQARIAALEIDKTRLSLESDRLIDKIVNDSDQKLTREAVLAQAQSKRLKGTQGTVVSIENKEDKSNEEVKNKKESDK